MRQPAARMTARRRAQRLIRPPGTVALLLSPPLLAMQKRTARAQTTSARQHWCATLFQWLAPATCRPRRQ